MKAVSSEMMKEIDRRTIAEFGIPGEVLMDRAGHGVARVVRRLADITGKLKAQVKLFAGRGNNGGDAYVAARYLAEWGFPAEVWLAGTSDAVTGDALTHLNLMREAGVKLHELPAPEDWDALAASLPEDDGLVVDALLGTGITGPAREPVASAIRCIRTLAQRDIVVAIDIPSGLNADTGEAPGETVAADVTVTMAMPKTGLLAPCAVDFVGTVEVIDIGVPDELSGAVESDLELVTPQELKGLFPPRARATHKGTFGHVLIIAGSTGYSGAPILAARAATRSGVGLVTALVPAALAGALAAAVPEAMVHPAPSSPAESLGPDSLALWHRSPNDFDAILIGPGLGSDGTPELVQKLLHGCTVPLVIDADALNACAGCADPIREARCPRVITPHPGEMGRLLGCSTADVQADRLPVAKRAAAATGSVTVLKGAGTIIATPEGRVAVNMTGNPGMATGGMGDVLGGLLAGLLAQGMAPFDAARSAVYLHGRAGDDAAWRVSQPGLTAGDVIRELLNVFLDLAGR